MKVIILDFDGVIIESNDIKDRAFANIFREYPDNYDKMMAYHYSHNAVYRYEKFRYFVEDVLKLSDCSDLIDGLVKKFNNLTEKAILECPFVNGASEFLDYVYKKYPLYLVSATPQKELNNVLDTRSLRGYFIKVFGAPLNKSFIISSIMSSENATNDETLFIGDSPEDQETAIKINIRFIGRKSDRPLRNCGYPIFDDLAEILLYIKNNLE